MKLAYQKNIQALFVLLLLFVFTDSNKTYAQQKAAKYQEILDKAIRDGLPAISALVQSATDETWKGSSGFTNFENSKPLDVNQSFRLASITKIYTSVIVLQLLDEKKIDLSDPISKYLDISTSTRIPHVNKITILHLLSHSSGIYSFTENNSFWKACYFNDGMTRVWDPTELLQYIENKKPEHPPIEPFSKKSYSNTNFILLGMIIEKVTGNSLSSEYQKRIFTPLEMNHTFLEGFDKQNKNPINSYAIPTTSFLKSAMKRKGIKKIDGSKLINLSQEYNLFNSWAWAAGGIASTTDDLLSFLSALKNGKLVSVESQKVLLLLNSSEKEGLTFFGGTGGSDGIQATMLHLMPNDVDIIILLNSSGHKEVNLSSVFKDLYKTATN